MGVKVTLLEAEFENLEAFRKYRTSNRICIQAGIEVE